MAKWRIPCGQILRTEGDSNIEELTKRQTAQAQAFKPLRIVRFWHACSTREQRGKRTASPRNMSQPAVIRAVPMFTKDGASKKINLIAEIAIGLVIGIGGGLTWQVGHTTCACVPPAGP